MTIEIPEHLEDLIETKPSSYEKLNEVFHELTIENQILILKYKIENHGGISYLEDEFYLNAIKSKNSYIRYLVAQYIGRTSLDDSETVKKIKKIIEKDTSDLVRFASLERDWIWPNQKYEDFYEIKNFLKFSQPKRLALVRSVTSSFDYIAKLFKSLSEAIKQNTISEVEVFEILSEFVKNKKLKEDMWRSSSYEISYIWKTVNFFTDHISSILVKNLPIDVAIPDDEIVLSMSASDLEKLMEREDYKKTEIRQKLFLTSLVEFKNNKKDINIFKIFKNTYDYNFSLNDEIVDGLIGLGKKGEDILLHIHRWSENLNLAELMAIDDIAKDNNIQLNSLAEMDRKIFLDNKINEYKKGKLNEREFDKVQVEVLRARIYSLSRTLVNTKIMDPQLKTYSKHINEKSIWKTYSAIISSTDYFFGPARKVLLTSLKDVYHYPEFDELMGI